MHKEQKKAVSALQKLTDLETDQESGMTVNMQRFNAECMISKDCRPKGMSGSNCDDGDQYSGYNLGKKNKAKPKPVSDVIFV